MTLQPMATAPRDGRRIYASMNGYALFPIIWADGKWIDVEFFCDKYDDSGLSGWLDIEALVRDKERLDWLEQRRRALNKYHGTEYGWKFVSSHNVNRLFVKDVSTIDLNDAEPHAGDIRAAIDKEMGRG